eukprot:scaffold26293_cov112-Isochrysis_galbana.AAC.9
MRVSRDDPERRTATALASCDDELDFASRGSRTGVSCADGADGSGIIICGASSTWTRSEEKRRREPRESRNMTERTPGRSAITGRHGQLWVTDGYLSCVSWPPVWAEAIALHYVRFPTIAVAGSRGVRRCGRKRSAHNLHRDARRDNRRIRCAHCVNQRAVCLKPPLGAGTLLRRLRKQVAAQNGQPQDVHGAR